MLKMSKKVYKVWLTNISMWRYEYNVFAWHLLKIIGYAFCMHPHRVIFALFAHSNSQCIQIQICFQVHPNLDVNLTFCNFIVRWLLGLDDLFLSYSYPLLPESQINSKILWCKICFDKLNDAENVFFWKAKLLKNKGKYCLVIDELEI